MAPAPAAIRPTSPVLPSLVVTPAFLATASAPRPTAPPPAAGTPTATFSRPTSAAPPTASVASSAAKTASPAAPSPVARPPRSAASSEEAGIYSCTGAPGSGTRTRAKACAPARPSCARRPAAPPTVASPVTRLATRATPPFPPPSSTKVTCHLDTSGTCRFRSNWTRGSGDVASGATRVGSRHRGSCSGRGRRPTRRGGPNRGQIGGYRNQFSNSCGTSSGRIYGVSKTRRWSGGVNATEGSGSCRGGGWSRCTCRGGWQHGLVLAGGFQNARNRGRATATLGGGRRCGSGRGGDCFCRTTRRTWGCSPGRCCGDSWRLRTRSTTACSGTSSTRCGST